LPTVERPSDSSFVEKIWWTRSEHPGTFISLAESHWEIVVTSQLGKRYITVRGPETRATLARSPGDAEFFGIVFKLGTYMPHFPLEERRDRNDLTLPRATGDSFWLNGAVWQLPDYENADTFVARLVHEGLLVREPVVEAALEGRLDGLSLRTVQRRFLHATGLTLSAVRKIERARQAASLLEQGLPILDIVYEAGYFDQPHLTKSLKHLVGQTPAQIARLLA
jgi:AraC-like DNA-binding protein